jgi:hypothetical protein
MLDQKPDSQDYLVKIIKSLTGGIPLVGGVLQEWIDTAIVPHHQKKMQIWFEYVDQTLTELVKNGQVTKEELFADERFASIFQKTSKAYLDNVEEYKKPVLRAYLKSSLTQSLALDKKYIFLNIIEELTETQLMILKDVFENHTSEERLYQSSLEAKLAEKYTNNNSEYLKLLIKGLQNNYLLNYTSAPFIKDKTRQWCMNPSQIGIELIEYIKID